MKAASELLEFDRYSEATSESGLHLVSTPTDFKSSQRGSCGNAHGAQDSKTRIRRGFWTLIHGLSHLLGRNGTETPATAQHERNSFRCHVERQAPGQALWQGRFD